MKIKLNVKCFDTADENIKKWLKEIVSEDKHGLSAKTLYDNILFSTGNENQLAQLFEVPVELIRAIKK